MKQFLLFILALPLGLFAQEFEDPYAVVVPVQTQLDAYNTGNLELFLSAYSDTVRIYAFPNTLRYQGKDKMRERYGNMFEKQPDLQCRLVSRTVMGDRVVDHESVYRTKDRPPNEVIAIYRVADGLIQEVWFMR